MNFLIDLVVFLYIWMILFLGTILILAASKQHMLKYIKDRFFVGVKQKGMT